MGLNIYLLDSVFNRYAIIEEFESFIWTDRYAKYGDFKLVLYPNYTMQLRLSTGNYLSQSDSDRIMIIEETLIEEEDGRKKMTVTGRSMESIFETRALAPNREEFIWAGQGAAGQLVVRMIETTCIEGSALIPDDVIPELYRNYADDTLESVSVAIKVGNLYDAVKEVCDSAGLGFRIQLLKTSPKLRFNVYRRELRENVIFGTTLDNLTSTRELKSQNDYRNIAYVWGKEGQRVTVAAEGISVYISGFRRKVLHVDASDIDATKSATTELYYDELRQRGREALAERKYVDLFDGKMAPVNPLDQITPYRIGDIISILDDKGEKHLAAINEFIWAYDQEGLRSYVTFESVE